MSEIFGKRLKQLRKEYGVSQVQLMERLDLKDPGTISKWENNRLEAGRDKIVKIAQMFHVTVDYLMGLTDDPKTFIPPKTSTRDIVESGFNVMYEQMDTVPTDFYDEIKAVIRENDPEAYAEEFAETSDNFLWVPVVEIEACAGNGSEYPDFQMTTTAMHPIMKTELLGHSWQNSGYKIFPISGDSMEPRFSDGDNVLVSIDENLSTGNIVVVWWRGKLYIRGYINHGNKVILKPLNAKYSPIEIEAGDTDLHIIGKVIARVPKIEKVEGIF